MAHAAQARCQRHGGGRFVDRGHLTGRGQLRSPRSRATCPDLVARQGKPDAGTEPVPGQRSTASVALGALHVHTLGLLRLHVSRPVLRSVREHVRHRLPARRRRPRELGLRELHTRCGGAAQSRMRGDGLERATRRRSGDPAVTWSRRITGWTRKRKPRRNRSIQRRKAPGPPRRSSRLGAGCLSPQP